MRVVVGQGSCGIATGAKKTVAALEKLIAEKGLNVEVGTVGCVGTCYLEPIVDVYEDNGDMTRYVKVQPEKVEEIVESHLVNHKVCEDLAITEEDKQFIGKQQRVVLRNCGIINPEDIDEYLAVDGYKAIEKVLKSMKPEEVIEEIKISGLRGRGGAGFPTWFKWNAAKASPGKEKYLVCNADEGDPGAFMDRSVLEGDPHSLIEGMIIGGYAMGASQGVIYCRAEYPLAIKRLEIAMAQARERGYLGKNIFGSGFDFDIYIKAGAGAFVCGEETALIASLEGERGMPRLKPPFPAAKGFWQKPTDINNVETLANVPWIIFNGGAAFGKFGTEASKGTKVFALAGKIKKGGLVEVPMGMTLREVLFGIGGGIKNDRQFKAVQMGGPSGGCIPAEHLDIPIDYDNLLAIGSMMGSGGLIVMDENTCMVDIAKFFLEFTVDESCGKCTPCRIGTKRLLEMLTKITEGKATMEDLDKMEQLCYYIKKNALCGLGQTAPNPVLSTLRYFRDEYIAHIVDKKCPAGVCKKLLKYSIDKDKCIGCGMCARNCPADAITKTDYVAPGKKLPAFVIDINKCIKCGACIGGCKFKAISRG